MRRLGYIAVAVMTAVEGRYDEVTYTYGPPAGYENWQSLVLKKRLHIHVKDNLHILPPAEMAVAED